MVLNDKRWAELIDFVQQVAFEQKRPSINRVEEWPKSLHSRSAGHDEGVERFRIERNGAVQPD